LITLEFENNKEVIHFLRTEKSFLFNEIFNEIKIANEHNEDIAVGAHLIVNDTTVVISVERPDWISHLELSLDYFLSEEDYEMCSKIRDLIDTI
jgi:hypothetical protein